MTRTSQDPHDAGKRSAAGRPEKVVVHGEGVRVDRANAEIPLAEVRSRFGGVDPVAVLAGVAAALGTLLVLSSLLSAAGAGGYGQVDQKALSIAAVIGSLVALVLSLLFGGYVAGRTGRYAGVRNGLLTGLVFLLLTAGLTALAASTDAADRLRLPGWLDRGDARTAALVTSLVAAALVLGAAALGGWLGARWHRGVDDVLVGTRAGGITPYVTEGSVGTGTAVPTAGAADREPAAAGSTASAGRKAAGQKAAGQATGTKTGTKTGKAAR
jgi:hypothetical protein